MWVFIDPSKFFFTFYHRPYRVNQILGIVKMNFEINYNKTIYLLLFLLINFGVYVFLELIGFARLCPGDTYEIAVKYGGNSSSSSNKPSKVRTRVKIAKDGGQVWNRAKFAFKITLDDSLSIKVGNWFFIVMENFLIFSLDRQFF